MTIEELQTIGIPLASYTEIDVLYVESALEWVRQHTTLTFETIEEIKNLPSGVKLFVLKYRELMKNPIGVNSESVGGQLTQGFSDTLKKDKLFEYAYELIGDYMKSSVSFIPAKRRYNSWR